MRNKIQVEQSKMNNIVPIRDFKDEIEKLSIMDGTEEVELHPDIKRNFNISLAQYIDKKGNSKFIVKVLCKVDIDGEDEGTDEIYITREFELQSVLNDKGNGEVYNKFQDLGYMNEALYDEIKCYLNKIWFNKEYSTLMVDDVFNSLGETSSIREEYKNLYLDFMDILMDDPQRVVLNKENFCASQHIGVLEKNFKGSGLDCLLIDGDVLLEELGLEKEQKDNDFRALMGLWKRNDLLYVRPTKSKNQRNTYRYELMRSISYAVKINNKHIVSIIEDANNK